MKTSSAFNTFIQSLPSAWSLPCTVEIGKNLNSAETRQEPKFPQNLRPLSLLSNTGKLRELYMHFKIHYVYDHIIKLCRTQAEIILTHVNPNVHGTGQGEPMYRKYKRLRPCPVWQRRASTCGRALLPRGSTLPHRTFPIKLRGGQKQERSAD
jgi:hypothetical protein